MVYTDESKPIGIRFYSFGSGENDIEIMDARIISGRATGEMECTGGTVMVDGMCVEDCHPECNGETFYDCGVSHLRNFLNIFHKNLIKYSIC